MGKPITEKVSFEQRSEEVQEPAMWISAGRLFQDGEIAAAHCEARVCLAF